MQVKINFRISYTVLKLTNGPSGAKVEHNHIIMICMITCVAHPVDFILQLNEVAHNLYKTGPTSFKICVSQLAKLFEAIIFGRQIQCNIKD